MMNKTKAKAKNTLLIQQFIYNAYLFPLYILQKRQTKHFSTIFINT